MRASRFALTLIIVFLATATLSPAWADGAPMCTNGSLADYMALGSSGCSVGLVTVSDFTYSSSLMSAPASEILVGPSTTDNEVIFFFVVNPPGPLAPWTVDANSSLQVNISMNMASTGIVSMIQVGSYWGGSFSNAGLDLLQTDCVGGGFNPNCSGTTSTVDTTWTISPTGFGTQSNSPYGFGPCNSGLYAQCGSGNAIEESPFQMGSVQTQFTVGTGDDGFGLFYLEDVIYTNLYPFPEPNTTSMLFAGVLGLGLIVAIKRRSQSCRTSGVRENWECVSNRLP